MIQRAELTRIAEAKTLPIKICEKDYLLEMALSILSEMKRELIFKGGTALYKFYNLNRFSEDLDFDLTGRRKHPEKLVETVTRRLETRGFNGTITEMDDYRNETNIRFLIRGPLYDGSKMSMVKIVINLSKRENPTSFDMRTYVPMYSDISSFQANVLSANEVAAEKYRCILTRDKARDIYDLWFLLKRGIKPETDLIDAKLSIYDLRYDKETMVEKILSSKGKWEKDLKGIVIGSLPSFSSITSDLIGWLP